MTSKASKYDFSDARIGILTIIEKQFGTLNIGADARLPDDRAEELRAKLDAIEAELAELREVDPAFADATTEVEAARAATDAAPAEPAAITDRLKAAAEALASVQKATTAARAIAERLAATAKWVGALLVGP